MRVWYENFERKIINTEIYSVDKGILVIRFVNYGAKDLKCIYLRLQTLVNSVLADMVH